MPKPTPTKPRTWPSLAHGDGSWSWDGTRRQVELRYMLNNKRVKERGDTPAECLDKRAIRRSEQEQRTERVAGLVDDITVTELARRWLGFVSSGKAPGTVTNYKWSRAIVIERLGDRAASDVDIEDIERVLIDLIAEGYSKSSLTRVRNHLGMMFKFGVHRRLVKSNPVASIEMPGGALAPRKIEWLDANEFVAMRGCLQRNSTTHKRLLLAMLLTGIRPGEATGLCWDNVDFAKRVIHVRSAIQLSQDNRVRSLVWTLKTESSSRTVQMPADLVLALKSERKDQAQRKLSSSTWAEPELVFTTETGEIIDNSNLGRACRSACLGASTKIVTPNGMRHTNASMLLHRGKSVAEVARHLGHDDLRMVTTTYGHAMVDVVSTAAILDAVV